MSARAIGVVGLAATIASLALGAGSASATKLCTAEPAANDGPCKGSVYPGSTAFSGSLTENLVINLGATGTIECIFSTVKGTIKNEGGGAGTPVGAEVASWIFGSKSEEAKNCVLVGVIACTISDAINVGYEANFAHSAGTKGNGTLTFKPHSGGGNPGMIVKCGTSVNCIFKAAEIQFVVVGGAPATAKVTNKAMELEGMTCPPQALLTATYKLTPSPLFVTNE
ncbi:MAG TPA: hypothetical protein VIY71_09645 [Solirubrobacterales bacterium]